MNPQMTVAGQGKKATAPEGRMPKSAVYSNQNISLQKVLGIFDIIIIVRGLHRAVLLEHIGVPVTCP